MVFPFDENAYFRLRERKPFLQMLVFVVAALWIYWPTLHGDWLWDDDVLVSGNSELRSLGGLGHIWFSAPTTDYWPLTWTLLWIEWHLWENAPLGYHLCSLALHLTSGFLIWRLLNRLGLREGWLGGLLFVIHPLAVESVAWISEIKNTLSVPLFLLSLQAWLDAEEEKTPGYRKSILYYLAAMLAKTSTVMLPGVLLLYCWWKRGRMTRQDITRLIPYGAIAAALGLVTIYFQTHGQDVHPVAPGDAVTRLTGAGTALFFYLGKFILPVNLLPIYPPRIPSSPLQALTIPALAGLLFGLWAQRKGWGRHALFGFGFFVLNALPVLGMVKMKYMNISWVADHLIYLPMIGLIGLVAAGWERLRKRIPSSLHLYGIGAVSIVMAGLAWESRGQAKLFTDMETLGTYAIEHNSQAWLAHNDLGVVLLAKDRGPEAIEQFEQALAIYPDYAEAHHNLGYALMQAGRASEAIDQFEQALRIFPDYVSAHAGLGNALLQTGRLPEAIEQFEQALKIQPDNAAAHTDLGSALAQTDRLPEAIEQFEQAVSLVPDDASAHARLGHTLLQAGRAPEAIEPLGQAVRIEPDNAGTHNDLGNALAQSGRAPEAIGQFEQALEIKPDFADAHIDLGSALMQAGRFSEAIGHYKRALEIDPDNAGAHYNLGNALLQTGLVPEATEHYEEALKIKPDFFEAHYNLGGAFLQTGRIPEAIEQYEEALKLRPDFQPALDHLAKAQALQKTAGGQN